MKQKKIPTRSRAAGRELAREMSRGGPPEHRIWWRHPPNRARVVGLFREATASGSMEEALAVLETSGLDNPHALAILKAHLQPAPGPTAKLRKRAVVSPSGPLDP